MVMLNQNIGANLIGVSSGILREMLLCGPFLFQRQVALTLTVILQPEKRSPHTCKGKTPSRQALFLLNGENDLIKSAYTLLHPISPAIARLQTSPSAMVWLCRHGAKAAYFAGTARQKIY